MVKKKKKFCQETFIKHLFRENKNETEIERERDSVDITTVNN